MIKRKGYINFDGIGTFIIVVLVVVLGIGVGVGLLLAKIF
jgi:hypothetical protein